MRLLLNQTSVRFAITLCFFISGGRFKRKIKDPDRKVLALIPQKCGPYFACNILPMPTHSMNSTSDGTAPNGILDMVHLQKCVRITTLAEVEQYLMVALCTCGVSGRNPLGIVDAKTAITRNRPHIIPLVEEQLSSNVSTYVPSIFSPSSLHAS